MLIKHQIKVKEVPGRENQRQKSESRKCLIQQNTKNHFRKKILMQKRKI